MCCEWWPPQKLRPRNPWVLEELHRSLRFANISHARTSYEGNFKIRASYLCIKEFWVHLLSRDWYFGLDSVQLFKKVQWLWSSVNGRIWLCCLDQKKSGIRKHLMIWEFCLCTSHKTFGDHSDRYITCEQHTQLSYAVCLFFRSCKWNKG